MEVKIELQDDQIGCTVLELFTNLSAEKKEELVYKVMESWFLGRISEEESIRLWRTNTAPGDILNPVLTNLSRYAQDVLEQKFKEDPKFQHILEATQQIIIERLPDYIKVATQRWFMSHMGELCRMGQENSAARMELGEFQQQLDERVQAMEHNVS